jgi:hypothetical protein
LSRFNYEHGPTTQPATEHNYQNTVTYLTSVDQNVHFRRSRLWRELNRILAHKLDRHVVRIRLGVEPGRAIYACVREVLISVLAEQSQEVHLHRTYRFVRDLEICQSTSCINIVICIMYNMWKRNYHEQNMSVRNIRMEN